MPLLVVLGESALRGEVRQKLRAVQTSAAGRNQLLVQGLKWGAEVTSWNTWLCAGIWSSASRIKGSYPDPQATRATRIQWASHAKATDPGGVRECLTSSRMKEAILHRRNDQSCGAPFLVCTREKPEGTTSWNRAKTEPTTSDSGETSSCIDLLLKPSLPSPTAQQLKSPTIAVQAS